MSKKDEIKEILNTLRVAMSIAFGILLVVTGSLIDRYDADKIDTIWWIGILFSLSIVVFIAFVIKKISTKTKEIKDL